MNALRWLLVVPITCAVLAVVLFFLQGGFGGGHGDFDRTIALLGLPSVLLTTSLPAGPGDFLGVVVLPAVLNIGIWFGFIHGVRKALRSRA